MLEHRLGRRIGMSIEEPIDDAEMLFPRIFEPPCQLARDYADPIVLIVDKIEEIDEILVFVAGY